jgi:hypothetical protein
MTRADNHQFGTLRSGTIASFYEDLSGKDLFDFRRKDAIFIFIGNSPHEFIVTES